MIASLAAVALLLGASVALGLLARRALRLPEGPGETALTLTAGLGILALLLAFLALGGFLAAAPAFVTVLAVPGWFTLAGALRRGRSSAPIGPGRPTLATAVAVLLVTLAALSALAPVTDPDSLAYPLPIARRLADAGVWRFWPDLALGVFPLSQELLLAFAMQIGADRLGVVSAFELVLCALLLDSLARRADLDERARGVALLVGLACPVVSYLAPSAKEDLLLAAMTLAAAHALLSLDVKGGAASAGLFAGLAAGAKYSGLPVAIGAVAAVLLASREDRVKRTAIAAACAALAGGVWYGVNLARFGNPVPPFFSPPLPTFHSPMSQRAAMAALRWGAGHGPLDLLLAPVRMLVEPARFGTAGGLFNPLAWVGLLALAAGDLRRRLLPLFVLAGALYAAWVATDQVARLLLPAALLLAVPAGEILTRLLKMLPPARFVVGAALALSAASVLLVSGVRLGRFLASPSAFVASETQNAAEIAFMNANLDPLRHRVATTFKSSFLLRVPWLNVDPVYQAEIPAEELGNVSILRAHGITHLFIRKGAMPLLEPLLVLVRENPASRLGGVRLFGEEPTVATALYALPGENRSR